MSRRSIRRLLPFLLSLAIILSAFTVQPKSAYAKSNGNLSDEQLENIAVIVDFLKERDFNSAAICGILANLDYEAGFKPQAQSKTGASIGICQWLGSRKEDLIDMFPSTYWTLESQLEYMYWEISNKDYTDKDKIFSNGDKLIKILLSVPDTEAGARTAGAAWCKLYERPANDTSADRGDYAVKIYWPMYGMTTQSPTIRSISNTSSGIQLSWNSVAGADGYIIKRGSENAKDLKEYDRTSSTSYTDQGAEYGSTYSYKVYAYNDDAVSEESEPPVVWTRLGAPTVKSAVNTDSGVKITWTASKGSDAVDAYRIYRKTSTSGWTGAATVDSDTLSWTDTKVSGGTAYTYTVRAVNASWTYEVPASGSTTKVLECVSAYDTTGVSSYYIPTPVPRASNTVNGIKILWSSCAGAGTYWIFRKSGSTWERLTTVKSSVTSWEWTDAVPGESYTFTVRAYASSGSSAYSKTGVTRTRLTVPVLKTITNLSSGIQITWAPVTGAKNYRIYRRTSDDPTWTQLDDTPDSACVWTDEDAPSGKTCIYTVRAVSGSNLSYYDPDGLSLLRLDVPELEQPSNVASGLTIRWKKVSGAKKYRIYRKMPGESSWTNMITVSASAVSWVDKDTKAGKVYTYTVKAISGSVSSTYDTSGISSVRLSTPVLSSAANDASGITVNWKAVTGAGRYYIYRKTSGTSWTQAGEAEKGSTSWTDSDVSNGKTYIYTVRAASSVTGSNVRSGYDSSGIRCYRLSQVKISGLTSQAGTGKMSLTWKANSKADGYLIRYTTDKSFKTYSTIRITGNTTAAKVISGLAKGRTYYAAIQSYHTVGLTTYRSLWNKTSVEVK